MNYAPRFERRPDPGGPPAGGGEVEALRLLAAARRRLGLILSTIFIGVLIAGLLALALPPRYGAESRLLLSPPQQSVVDLSLSEGGPGGETAFVESQIELLRSDALMGAVADRLRLRAPTQPVEAETLKETVNIRRKGASYVVGVTATADDPALAAAIANETAAAYLADEAAWRAETLKEANVWLETRLAEVRASLAASERAVERFRAENGLLSAGGATLNARRRADLDAEALAVSAALAERTARLSEMERMQREGRNLETAPAGLLSSAVIALQNRRGRPRSALRNFPPPTDRCTPNAAPQRRSLPPLKARSRASSTGPSRGSAMRRRPSGRGWRPLKQILQGSPTRRTLTGRRACNCARSNGRPPPIARFMKACLTATSAPSFSRAGSGPPQARGLSQPPNRRPIPPFQI